MSIFPEVKWGGWKKGICTVASLSSLQKLHYRVLLKNPRARAVARYGDAGRGLEMKLLISSLCLDTDIQTEFYVGATYLARIPPTCL